MSESDTERFAKVSLLLQYVFQQMVHDVGKGYAKKGEQL